MYIFPSNRSPDRMFLYLFIADIYIVQPYYLKLFNYSSIHQLPVLDGRDADKLQIKKKGTETERQRERTRYRGSEIDE